MIELRLRQSVESLQVPRRHDSNSGDVTLCHNHPASAEAEAEGQGSQASRSSYQAISSSNQTTTWRSRNHPPPHIHSDLITSACSWLSCYFIDITHAKGFNLPFLSRFIEYYSRRLSRYILRGISEQPNQKFFSVNPAEVVSQVSRGSEGGPSQRRPGRDPFFRVFKARSASEFLNLLS